MSKMPIEFDLTKEPWIPVSDIKGNLRLVGLRELFNTAHELQAVVDPSPLATFGIYRLLLALMHRVVNGPRNQADWSRLWEAGVCDPAAYTAYFDQWSHRFNLFDERYPFYQVADFTIVDKMNQPKEPTPVAVLLPQLASGNNATLFDHTSALTPVTLSGAEAARALIVAQAWGLGGGKGPTSNKFGAHPYTAHAPCVGAIATLVMQPTLYRTLVANLLRIGPAQGAPLCSDKHDRPSWERDEPRLPKKAVPTGYLEYLTWLPRHVRLLHDADQPGRTSAMFIAQGAIVESEANYDSPFAAYRVDEKGGKLAVRASVERAVWRDADALLVVARTNDKHAPQPVKHCRTRAASKLLRKSSNGGLLLDIQCFGYANDKAKPLLWRHERIASSARFLDDAEACAQLETALKGVEQVFAILRLALWQLAYQSLNAEDKPPDTKEVSRVRGRLVRDCQYWNWMEPYFHRFVQQVSAEARQQWLKAAAARAEQSLLAAATKIAGRAPRREKALAIAERAMRAKFAKAAVGAA